MLGQVSGITSNFSMRYIMSDPRDREREEREEREREERERWERVQEMEREVEEDGGDPNNLYDFD